MTSRKRNIESIPSQHTTSRYGIFNSKKQNKESRYYLKSKRSTELLRIYELEAYGGQLSKFLATRAYVPPVHVYYDNQEQPACIASKDIGFKSNQTDPVLKQDIIIECSAIQREHQQRILMDEVEHLLELIQKEPTSLASEVYQTVFCSFFSAPPSTEKMKQCLSQYKTSEARFTLKELDALLKLVNERINFIKSPLSNETWRLYDVINTIEQIKKIALPDKNETGISELEAFDILVKEKNINLHETEFLDEELFGVRHKIKTSDLMHYRIIKGLATTLSTRFIFKEGDNNNSNMSKDGKIIDFGWTKANIVSEYMGNDLFSYQFKQHDTLFSCSPQNIQHFPDVRTNLFYWPTKQPELYKFIIQAIAALLREGTNIHLRDDGDTLKQIALCVARFYENDAVNESIIQLITHFVFNLTIKIKALVLGIPEQKLSDQAKIEYLFNTLQRQYATLTNVEEHQTASIIEGYFLEAFGNKKNIFTKEDNNIFKSLATHPVFIFHKYKTFLKYLLTDEKLYRALAELTISEGCKDAKYKKEDLIQKLIDDEMARIKEIRHTLISMPDFKLFLQNRGAQAYKMIQKEYIEYQEKYAQKIADKPYYRELVEAVPVQSLEERFREICLHADVDASDIGITIFTKKL